MNNNDELRRLAGLNEAKDSNIDSVSKLVKGNSLLAAGEALKSAFGKRNVEFIMLDMIPPHYRIKIGGKTIVVISKKYADKPDAIVGDIAIGYIK